MTEDGGSAGVPAGESASPRAQGPDSGSPFPEHAPPRRRRVRRVRWLVLGLVIALFLLVGFTAWDGVRLYNASDRLTTYATVAGDAVAERDTAALDDALTHVADEADTFYSATHGPHWWVLAHAPWVKDQAVPLRAAAEAVREVSDTLVEPLAEIGITPELADPGFAGGRIDPDILAPYAPLLSAAAPALAEQAATLEAVDLDGTDILVERPFVELRDRVSQLAEAVDTADGVATLLPGMLGGEGERRYLVLVQNNAEPRATGGIPGAVLELGFDDGAATLGEYASASDLSGETDAITLTDEEDELFTYRLAEITQNANLTPEFPRTAEIVSAQWEAKHSYAPDGVISIDPVALKWMLGPDVLVEVDGIEVSSDTLPKTMLNQIYFDIDGLGAQDRFFAGVAQAMFEQVVAGSPVDLAGIGDAVSAGRLLVWSADASEQALLAGYAIAGAFLEGDGAGVFLNDGSGSKIGWYVDVAVEVRTQACTDGTARHQTVTTTLTHWFDGNLDNLPWYIGRDWKAGKGVFVGNLIVYAPPGMGVLSATVDGEEADLYLGTHEGRSVGVLRVEVAPGEASEVKIQVGGRGPDALDGVSVTPGPRAGLPTVSESLVQAEGC